MYILDTIIPNVILSNIYISITFRASSEKNIDIFKKQANNEEEDLG